MDQPQHVGARLKRLRLALGFDQAKDFAEYVGINEQAWNHFERGRRFPLPPDAIKVAVKTGATLDWIYRGLPDRLPLDLARKIEAIPEPEIKPLRLRLLNEPQTGNRFVCLRSLRVPIQPLILDAAAHGVVDQIPHDHRLTDI